MKTADIQKMTKAERLETMEALWNSLVQDGAVPDSPGWHLDMLQERKERIDDGKTGFITLEELKKM